MWPITLLFVHWSRCSPLRTLHWPRCDPLRYPSFTQLRHITLLLIDPGLTYYVVILHSLTQLWSITLLFIYQPWCDLLRYSLFNDSGVTHFATLHWPSYDILGNFRSLTYVCPITLLFIHEVRPITLLFIPDEWKHNRVISGSPRMGLIELTLTENGKFKSSSNTTSTWTYTCNHRLVNWNWEKHHYTPS